MEKIKRWIEMNKISFYGGIGVLVIVCLVALNLRPQTEEGIKLNHLNALQTETDAKVMPLKEEKAIAQKGKQEKSIHVDIKGAVKYSGVYPAQSNQIVNDIITLAVPLKNADLDAVNRARMLQDGMVIYIPYKGEVKENKYQIYNNQNDETQQSTSTNNKVININTADVKALEEIPGIGPKKAQDILQYREQNNGFKSIDEIKEIKGIGDKTFEGLKDTITINE
ncbi:helix-hairpin-helix domain-containing protein [Macrococcoides caseolyticum]|uniref:helix-hairpin-helix domain-containing protein n=1 Tax=Macrococcoides caseolyticum TaxID=69966 RepID=UPI001F193A26|nr:helix-hairpin-helix domain-containing protein [Macrococcus caseolyticus]MCE4956169.1 helix-hairpin-helix domain-containing protein [Macrococcus caseolyticus]